MAFKLILSTHYAIKANMLTLRLLVTMAILWLLLSGHYTNLLLALGGVSALLVVWLSGRMGVLRHRGQPIYFGLFHLLVYWGWLAKQILLSNIEVTKRILSPTMPIKPTLRRVAATPDTDMGRVIYANSITLTPGTTAINFTPEEDVLVHALHEDSLHELEEDQMASRVRALEPLFKPVPLTSSDEENQ